MLLDIYLRNSLACLKKPRISFKISDIYWVWKHPSWQVQQIPNTVAELLCTVVLCAPIAKDPNLVPYKYHKNLKISVFGGPKPYLVLFVFGT